MTDTQIGYAVIGAVVAGILLWKRWRARRKAEWMLQSTVYETPGFVWIVPEKPRRKGAWGVIIVAGVILYAILSH